MSVLFHFMLKLLILEHDLITADLLIRQSKPDKEGNVTVLMIQLDTRSGGGDFLMSGIRVCATNQGRFFTSKNPEQAPNFEVLLQNRPYFLKVYSRTGSFYDNLVSNAWLKCQNPSCFQLLFPAARCLHFCSIILEQVFQGFYNWDQFESGHMYSSLNLT